MRNLAFVIWVLGGLLVYDITLYLQFLTGEAYSDITELIFLLVYFTLLGIVGGLLYESKEEK